MIDISHTDLKTDLHFKDRSTVCCFQLEISALHFKLKLVYSISVQYLHVYEYTHTHTHMSVLAINGHQYKLDLQFDLYILL